MSEQRTPTYPQAESSNPFADRGMLIRKGRDNVLTIEFNSKEEAHAAAEYLFWLSGQPAERTADDASGPREPPESTYILHEISRLAKGAALGKAVYGLCPAGCGCVWRDNFDGTMSLGMNQRSCKVCEFKPFDELIPLYARPAVETVGRQCACEQDCQPEQNEGRECRLSEARIPPGHFSEKTAEFNCTLCQDRGVFFDGIVPGGVPCECKAQKASAVCQHDRTKPNPTLTWTGSWGFGTNDQRYVCTRCLEQFRVPSSHAQNGSEVQK